MRIWRGALALVVLVMVFAGLAQTSQGHALLKNAGLYEEPASYTELAFAAPGELPTQLKSTPAQVKVAFQIHNVSPSARAYKWSIELVRSGATRVAASGSATASAQGRVTVDKTLTAACPSGRLQVVVRLVGQAESIDFWAACPPSKRSAR